MHLKRILRALHDPYGKVKFFSTITKPDSHPNGWSGSKTRCSCQDVNKEAVPTRPNSLGELNRLERFEPATH